MRSPRVLLYAYKPKEAASPYAHSVFFQAYSSLAGARPILSESFLGNLAHDAPVPRAFARELKDYHGKLTNVFELGTLNYVLRPDGLAEITGVYPKSHLAEVAGKPVLKGFGGYLEARALEHLRDAYGVKRVVSSGEPSLSRLAQYSRAGILNLNPEERAILRSVDAGAHEKTAKVLLYASLKKRGALPVQAGIVEWIRGVEKASRR